MPAFVKYTVFLSSTHDDLQHEREQVADAILKLGHIPCGMEQFSAGSGRGWNVITQTIDICDYYVLIVAGRYGTMFPGEDVSWTEKEYNYARSRNLDPLAFLRHRDHTISSRMDDEPSAIMHRQAFIRRIDEECRRELWTTSEDLCARVTMALTKQIADDQRLGRNRPGWFRGDDLPGDAKVTSELARLSAENAELRAALARALTPLKPSLQIQTRRGDPIPEKLELQLIQYSMTPDSESANPTLSGAVVVAAEKVVIGANEGDLLPTQGREAVSEDDLEEAKHLREWVRALSRLFWIRLQVANSGPVPARDVRVRVTVSPVEFVAYADLDHFSKYRRPMGDTDDREYKSDGSVAIVSNSESEEAVFIHKIPSVGVDRKQILTGMAFLALGDLATEQIVTVNISMDEESGAKSQGQMQLRLTTGPIWSGNASAIRDHANALRMMLRE